jgi:hypothetical protein
MTSTVIDDPGYRMSPSFSREEHLWNLTEHQTFFSANGQAVAPAPEEIVSPFAKAHVVGGDARGSQRDAAHARAT